MTTEDALQEIADFGQLQEMIDRRRQLRQERDVSNDSDRRGEIDEEVIWLTRRIDAELMVNLKENT